MARKIKIIHVPMFFQKGLDVHFVYMTDMECYKYIKSFVTNKEDVPSLSAVAGSWSYIYIDPTPIYIIRVTPTTYINYRTIVHECVHMAQHVCEAEGIKDEEFPALFTGWLADEYIQWVGQFSG